jgi:saccharopine dehydrogenase-like NADP-dependent oxidoreductase
MIDHYNRKGRMTSMARTTAFPCSIAAQLLAEGKVQPKGLVPPELAFRGDLQREFMRRLQERGIKISLKKSSRSN